MDNNTVGSPSVEGRAVTGRLSKNDRRSLMDLCEKRSSTYALISRLFYVEVDEEVYASLKEATFPAKTGNEKVDIGYRKLATYVSNDHDDPLLQLAIDYARIFIGHGNTAYSAAYPFESVYTSEKRLLMQEARDEIVRAYTKAGLVITDAWKDPEDHVALELEYMQIMSNRTKEALENDDDNEALALLAEQRDFLQRHLTSWVPMLTSDMRRFAKTDFYQGLSYLVEGFLRQDKDLLTSVVQEEHQ